MAAATSSIASLEEHNEDPNTGQWESASYQHEDDQASPSTDNGAVHTPTESKPTPTVQKRRRVTRACDVCRQKKIKCDGKSPCTHCTVYSYECTYDQPSNRRRNPPPQYIEAIEIRLRRAQALLKKHMPEVDLDDSKLDELVSEATDLVPKRIPTTTRIKEEDSHVPVTENGQLTDHELESMVKTTGSLDLDESGYWDYHGTSSGLVFIRRMREQFGDLMGQAEISGSPFVGNAALFSDSPRSLTESPSESAPLNTHDLPPKSCALDLCYGTLQEACSILRFVHQPTFYKNLDRIYELPVEQWGSEENRFLPLLYTVLAVGSIFSRDSRGKLMSDGYGNATDKGFVYFKAARQMMDITDCRDLTSLQAVVFMIMFLQSSAKLATCYSYIGVALTSAIRLGLHRSVSRHFDPIEAETRRRVFWIIRKMDMYVAALLGLPKLLSDDDIDQVDPLEVDDECITKDGILPQPSGKVPLISATNAHTRLVKILCLVVKHIYPIKGPVNGANKVSKQTYGVSYARIREIEQKLQEWMEDLSADLKPGGNTVCHELARAQQLLRLAYAHVQMLLYRPFLHYVSHSYQDRKRGTIDRRSYACAAACVSVSRNIIHITIEMKRKGLLIGSYWFTMYTAFFAILSLAFMILENPAASKSEEILQDVMDGKEALASLSKRSMAADRCTKTLEGLFGQLPEKLKRSRSSGSASRKRTHDVSPDPTSCSKVKHNATDSPRNLKKDCASMPRPPAVTNLKDPWASSAAAPLSLNTPTSLDTYPMTPNDPHTPTSSNVLTPDTANSSSINIEDSQSVKPLSQWDFSYSPDYNTQGLPDISSMMFPSADPFEYPTQPMMTLEDGQFAQSPTFQNNMNGLFDMSPTSNGNAPFDNIDAQLFGPLPPYLMQGQTEQQPELNMQDLERQIAMAPAANEQMMGFGGEGMRTWPPEQQQPQLPMASVQHQKPTQDRMSDKQQAEVLDGNLFGSWNRGWRNQNYGQG